MVLNNTICYVGKACKYGLVHTADGSKVVVQGLEGYVVTEKLGQQLDYSLKEELGFLKNLKNSLCQIKHQIIINVLQRIP